MTSLHPEDRSTCEQYYTEAYGRLFPSSFYDYFYDFIAATNEFNASSYQSAMTMSRSGISGSSTPQIGQTVEAPASIQETDTPPLLPTNADEIINRIWSDYEHIEKHLRPESRQHEMSLDEQPHTSLHWSEVSNPLQFSYPVYTCLTLPGSLYIPSSCIWYKLKHTWPTNGKIRRMKVR